MANNAAVIAALGSIAMNISTIVIIFFNMHQVRINHRSLNIDINFRVFELRKKIYRETGEIIARLKEVGNFMFFVENKDGEFKPNESFQKFKASLDDSKYLFSHGLRTDLERFLLLCEHGVALECQTLSLKEQSIDSWTQDTTTQLQDFDSRKKELLDCIYDFNTDQFLKYLNISNFHKDFISEESFDVKSFSLKNFTHIAYNGYSFLANKNKKLRAQS